MRDFLDTLSDLWAFLRERKRYWLLPIVLALLLAAALATWLTNSALAPFVYPIF